MNQPKPTKASIGPFDEALKRIGHTPESRVRWLLRVASLPKFDDLSDAEQAALTAEMEAFLDPTGDSSRNSLREDFVVRWQARIRAGIDKLERGRAWAPRLVTHVNLWVPRKDQKRGAVHRKGKTPGYMEPLTPNALQSKQTPKDQMAHEISTALQAVAKRLRRCPGCRTLFVRNRRQVYCSKRCGWLARQRRHRAPATP